eukprot:929104-Alexandrium_andersonii.AAC.1
MSSRPRETAIERPGITRLASQAPRGSKIRVGGNQSAPPARGGGGTLNLKQVPMTGSCNKDSGVGWNRARWKR